MVTRKEPRRVSPRVAYLLLAAAGAAGVLATGLLGSWMAGAVSIVTIIALAYVFFRMLAPNTNYPEASVAGSSEMLPAVVREIFQSLADPIIVLAASGHVVFANRASQAILGSQLARKHIAAVLRAPAVLEAVDRVQTGGDSETVAFGFLVPVERHFEAFVARAGQGAGPHLVLIQLHDLTAVRRSEQMRADFVANVSHELRTPLAAVGGFVDTLRGHAREDDAARERFLEIMSEETSRMRRLIDDLLSLTRIELNEHNPPQGLVDLAAVARDAAAALAPIALSEGVKLDVARHDRLAVKGDRDELIQVMQNLMHNAIKYGKRHGRVQVSLGRAGDGLAYAAVADEGEGIPREAIPRLTERFFRVDARQSRERGGTGLGLAIVKHIMNRHQGRLQIESTPGKGSTFTVILPVAPEFAQDSDATAANVMKM